MKLMKDMGTQSYIWSGFSTWLAWLGEQQNLMLLSLAIGIVTAIAGLIQRNRIYSDKEIAERWAKDLKIAESCVNRHFNGKDMNDNQFSGMTSAVFNMGCYNMRFYRNKQGQYVQTTIHKLAVNKQFEEMCHRLPDFIRASGKVLNGLVIRREKEKALCLTGLVAR
ncbi:glycoside hydrolase family protein [Mannheimia haemolytica]|nr:glycoside hydrolase family protein [Mannheimia haemolytica]